MNKSEIQLNVYLNRRLNLLKTYKLDFVLSSFVSINSARSFLKFASSADNCEIHAEDNSGSLDVFKFSSCSFFHRATWFAINGIAASATISDDRFQVIPLSFTSSSGTKCPASLMTITAASPFPVRILFCCMSSEVLNSLFPPNM